MEIMRAGSRASAKGPGGALARQTICGSSLSIEALASP